MSGALAVKHTFLLPIDRVSVERLIVAAALIRSASTSPLG